MLATGLERQIREIIEAPMNAMGYLIVQVRMNDGAKRKVLQVVAERRDEDAMSIDDCEAISTLVSALLDVEDPIAGAYQLEVSSPGLDRPLTSEADFARFIGQEAKVEMMMPLEGRKRFQGIIEEVKNGTVQMRVEKNVFALAVNNMRSAKLVLTEALFRQALKRKTH